ncbi:Collagen alpha1(XI) chainlike, partial [Caligus rogercresseyi]
MSIFLHVFSAHNSSQLPCVATGLSQNHFFTTHSCALLSKRLGLHELSPHFSKGRPSRHIADIILDPDESWALLLLEASPGPRRFPLIRLEASSQAETELLPPPSN